MACQSKAYWQAWNEKQIHRGDNGADLAVERQRTAGAGQIDSQPQADSGAENACLLSARAFRARPPHFCESTSLEDALRRAESMLREAGSRETWFLALNQQYRLGLESTPAWTNETKSSDGAGAIMTSADNLSPSLFLHSVVLRN
jgi:hypothetical protein